jgi:hypothetical protein
MTSHLYPSSAKLKLTGLFVISNKNKIILDKFHASNKSPAGVI